MKRIRITFLFVCVLFLSLSTIGQVFTDGTYQGRFLAKAHDQKTFSDSSLSTFLKADAEMTIAGDSFVFNDGWHIIRGNYTEIKGTITFNSASMIWLDHDLDNNTKGEYNLELDEKEVKKQFNILHGDFDIEENKKNITIVKYTNVGIIKLKMKKP